MRIEQSGGPPGRVAGRRRLTPAGFALPAEHAEQAEESQPAAASSAALPILSIDAAPPPGAALPSNQAAAEHGGAVLDALAGLQLATLAPDDGQARSALAALSQGIQHAADPALDALLQAIAARAAIALAHSGDPTV